MDRPGADCRTRGFARRSGRCIGGHRRHTQWRVRGALPCRQCGIRRRAMHVQQFERHQFHSRPRPACLREEQDDRCRHAVGVVVLPHPEANAGLDRLDGCDDERDAEANGDGRARSRTSARSPAYSRAARRTNTGCSWSSAGTVPAVPRSSAVRPTARTGIRGSVCRASRVFARAGSSSRSVLRRLRYRCEGQAPTPR